MVAKQQSIQGETTMKVCSKCRKLKSLDEIGKDKRREDGTSSHCKECKSESRRKYYELNKEKEREQGRCRYETNKGKSRHRDAKYREENREKMRAKADRFRKANPGKQNEFNRKWQIANPEKVREANKNWASKNLERVRNNARKWQKDNPERVMLNSQMRRARKASLPNSFTLEHQAAVLTHFKGGCSLTGSIDFHMDHVLPLACGYGGTILENMIPLRNDLNFSKSSSHIFEWFEANKERFDLEQHKFNELIEYLARINEMTTKEYRAYVDWCFDNPIEVVIKDIENEEKPNH